jgi:hypothetical protein
MATNHEVGSSNLSGRATFQPLAISWPVGRCHFVTVRRGEKSALKSAWPHALPKATSCLSGLVAIVIARSALPFPLANLRHVVAVIDNVSPVLGELVAHELS